MVLILAPITPHMEIFMRGRLAKNERRRGALNRMEAKLEQYKAILDEFYGGGNPTLPFPEIKIKGSKLTHREMLEIKIKRVEQAILGTVANLNS